VTSAEGHEGVIAEPKVSIIIPVYNVERYLQECLDSVYAQTLQEIEIICVNDGSTDSSAKILEQNAARDARIKVLTKKNGGLSSARNAGLSVARGEYLSFLDSDDCLVPQALELCCNKAETDALDMVLFGAEAFFDTEEAERNYAHYKGYYIRKGSYLTPASGKALFEQLFSNSDYRESACLYMLSRSYVEQLNFRFIEGIIHEDDVFTLKALILAQRVAVLPEAFHQRRVRENSIVTATNQLTRVNGKFMGQMALLDDLSEYGITSADSPELAEYLCSRLDLIRGMYLELDAETREGIRNGSIPFPLHQISRGEHKHSDEWYSWMFKSLIIDVLVRDEHTSAVLHEQLHGQLYEQLHGQFETSRSYRLGRFLTAPLRALKH